MACILRKCLFLLIAVCLLYTVLADVEYISRDLVEDLHVHQQGIGDCHIKGWHQFKGHWREKSRYSTCLPPYEDDPQDCYLPYKTFSTHKANMIIVDIEMTVRLCKTIPRKNCVENFHLYLRKGGGLSNEVTSGNPFDLNDFNNRTVFEELSIVPEPFESAQLSGRVKHVNTKIKIHKASMFDSFQLALRTRYFCGTLQNIKISYNKCPVQTNNLVEFDEIAAPDEGDPDIEIRGKCVKNAIKKTASDKLLMKCRPDGTADVIGECFCEDGYTKKGNQCVKECNDEFQDCWKHSDLCGMPIMKRYCKRTCKIDDC